MPESRTIASRFAISLVFALICSVYALGQSEASGTITGQVHRIGAGDQIQIRVSDHLELSKTVVVDSEGNISLPVPIGVVQAAGKSVGDLAGIIRHDLGHLDPKPQVTVTIGVRRSVQPRPEIRDPTPLAPVRRV